MLARCLACAHAFPTNGELEWTPVGRRVAFDSRRGRLWLICAWCGHWSLVPIEARWEAVEELESRAGTRAVVLATTQHVSLLALGGVQALRVGGALPREEAWWRYGRTLRGRQLRYSAITRAGGTIASAVTVTGLTGLLFVLPEAALFRTVRSAPGRARRTGAEVAESFERWFRYGRYAWRGTAPCSVCGRDLASLEFRDRTSVLLETDGSIRVRCRQCSSTGGWHVITDTDAEQLLRRTLAWENIAGATDEQLQVAMSFVRSGELAALTRAGPLPLRQTPREQLIALELAAAHRYEARLLGWEVAELEARWRVEETTAAIIDRELTPMPDHGRHST